MIVCDTIEGTEPMHRILVAAVPLGGSVLPGAAGITCNLTDQRSNVLQYSFTRGGHGYTNEVAMRRNRGTVSNGGRCGACARLSSAFGRRKCYSRWGGHGTIDVRVGPPRSLPLGSLKYESALLIIDGPALEST
jgi:hypothetical protein